MHDLQSIAKALVSPKKGILAADESTGTIKKRLDSIGVESTEETRRDYRELLFTTPGLEQYISGVIFFDETIRQSTRNGVSFTEILKEKGIIVGIKVDGGLIPFNNSDTEKITVGLDGLAERLDEYYALGARFAKWRAVISISDTLPSRECVAANAKLMSKYAKLCQEKGLVPIVEPEVLMTGNHNINRCFEVTEMILKIFFEALQKENVALEGMLLKPNMVIPGEKAEQAKPQEVAEMTIKCLSNIVPSSVPGIVFLSGGQTEQEACENLQAIASLSASCPWELSFSYGRALQASALKTWGGKPENFQKAQEVFFKRSRLTSAARCGEYKNEMEMWERC